MESAQETQITAAEKSNLSSASRYLDAGRSIGTPAREYLNQAAQRDYSKLNSGIANATVAQGLAGANKVYATGGRRNKRLMALRDVNASGNKAAAAARTGAMARASQAKTQNIMAASSMGLRDSSQAFSSALGMGRQQSADAQFNAQLANARASANMASLGAVASLGAGAYMQGKNADLRASNNAAFDKYKVDNGLPDLSLSAYRAIDPAQSGYQANHPGFGYRMLNNLSGGW